MVLLRKVPGMTIFAPSSYQELGVMPHDALDLLPGPPPSAGQDRGPSVGPTRSALACTPAWSAGAPTSASSGRKMLAAATEAAEALEAEGVSVTVWDPRWVKPFDEAMSRTPGSTPQW